MYALEGIAILDLTRQAPGPYCTMLLGDMGADILKVEEPVLPGTGRRAAAVRQPQPSPEEQARALAFSAMGRNKRSIVLNLREPQARDIFYRLCQRGDVVLEGFRPGVVKRLGVDYEAVSRINPRIVYCSLTGYGQNGPHSRLAGHDINYISQGGALALIGDDPNGRPTIPLNLLADMAGGGAHAAFGIVCALMARERTGRGQLVDVAMADGVTQIISGLVASYFQTGRVTPRGTHGLAGTRVHYNVYQCGDGKWISIGSLEPYFYENFCRALGRDDWVGNEYADAEAHAIMIAQAREVFRTRTRDEWFDLLNQTDQCAMKVLAVDELQGDPQVVAREMIIELEHPAFGTVAQTGFTPKLSETAGGFRRFAPRPGEHTDEVLAGLGFSLQEIEDLRKAGTVG